MIKLVASDMDGTLLNSRMRISETNRSSILNLQKSGVEFIVATGRDYKQIAPLLKEQGIKCSIIGLNGATFHDTEGKQLFSHNLPVLEVKKIIQTLTEKNIFVELMTSQGIFSDSKEKRLAAFALYIQEMNPKITYAEALSFSEKEADNLHIQFVDSYESVLNDAHTDVYKLSAYTEEDPSILFPVKETLLQRHSNLSITSFHESNLEINHRHAQKGRALSEYAKERGWTSDQVMAIGDNSNDISMLQWATHSVAMMNGLASVKELASHITLTNDDHGVSEVIERLVLNNKNIL